MYTIVNFINNFIAAYKTSLEEAVNRNDYVEFIARFYLFPLFYISAAATDVVFNLLNNAKVERKVVVERHVTFDEPKVLEVPEETLASLRIAFAAAIKKAEANPGTRIHVFEEPEDDGIDQEKLEALRAILEPKLKALIAARDAQNK